MTCKISWLAMHQDLLFYQTSQNAVCLADEASKRLKAAGFQKISERNPWKGLKTGGKYYFTRNASTIVAFAIGSKYTAGNGFHMIGAHTDR